MTNITHTPFLVLGGGIAGLTFAIALHQRNIPVIVAEAAPAFTHAGSGLSLAANALKAFRYLGMEQCILKAANPLKQLNITDEKGKLISSTQADTIGDGTPLVAVHRGTLQDLLLQHLPEDVLLYGHRVASIQPAGSGYRVFFDNGAQITADYLVGADGIHSAARSLVAPAAKLRYAGYTCWRGVTENNLDWPAHRAIEAWCAAGRAGIVPINNYQLYWFVVKNAMEESAALKAYTTQDLVRDFRHFEVPIGKLIAATNPDDLFHHDIYDLKPLSQFAEGNLVLIGDAAHASTPNMAQGACQAIEDGVTLAHCLGRHSVISQAFKSFEKLRMARTQMIVSRSRTVGKIGQLSNPLLIALRNLAFRNLPASLMRKQLEKIYTFELV